MTRKDCIHYDVCYENCDGMDMYALMQSKKVEKFCNNFKDKSIYIELPCKVGDTIYFDTYRRGESIGVQPHKVAKVDVVVSTERPFGCVGADIYDWQFGKTVFLTREEAEKALEERRVANS